MHEFAVLQAVRLKGRADAATVSCSTNLPEAQAELILSDLLGRALVRGGPSFRVTPEGRSRLAQLLDEERTSVDARALEAAYEDFHALNDALKQVVTAWQLRGDEVPNDHTDPSYDDAVVARLLNDVDVAFRPLLDRVLGLAPRLRPYRPRFDRAVIELLAGNTAYLARPVMDSYHTIWFELHEELIGLLGRTRADEALAGRAE